MILNKVLVYIYLMLLLMGQWLSNVMYITALVKVSCQQIYKGFASMIFG